MAEAVAPDIPRPLRRLRGAGVAAARYATAFAGVRYGVKSSEAAELARGKVLAALDRLEAELDGNEYLVGDRFSVADLTAAALFYPLAFPPEGPTVPCRRRAMRASAPRWRSDPAIAGSRRCSGATAGPFVPATKSRCMAAGRRRYSGNTTSRTSTRRRAGRSTTKGSPRASLDAPGQPSGDVVLDARDGAGAGPGRRADRGLDQDHPGAGAPLAGSPAVSVRGGGAPPRARARGVLRRGGWSRTAPRRLLRARATTPTT